MPAKNEVTAGNSILAVVCGAAGVVVTALILYPLESLVADQFFELNFGNSKPSLTNNDIIFMGSVIVWFSFSAFSGGLVTALISRAYPYRHIWVLTGITIIFIFIVTMNDTGLERHEYVFGALLIACTVIGYLLGGKTAINIKTKRKERKEKQII